MKALEITGVGKIELNDIEIPKLKDEEVRVKVSYCGICGSDIPRYFNGGVHSFPQVVGHEFSGIITELGSKVENLSIGQRVVVAPLIPKNDSESWINGNPAMDSEYSFIGSRQQGAMAEYVNVPAKNIVLIPENVSLRDASLTEPLTVAIHGVDRFPMEKLGESALVFGAGTIGLLTIAALKNKGAGKIICVELNPNKKQIALEMGADIFINPTETDLNKYLEENGYVDFVVETAGSNITQKQCLEVTKKGGKIIYLGTMEKPIEFEAKEFEQILRKELLITGSRMSYSTPFPGYEWTTALNFISTGNINVNKIITSYHKLEDAENAFNALKEGKDEIKVLFEIGGGE